jgi:hypothetical protein
MRIVNARTVVLNRQPACGAASACCKGSLNRRQGAPPKIQQHAAHHPPCANPNHRNIPSKGIAMNVTLKHAPTARSIVTRSLLAAAIAAVGVSAHAQHLKPLVQRDMHQQERIHSGLKDGSLTTREAAGLEQKEGQLDRLQPRDLKDGKLSADEQRQIEHKENRISQDIYTERHNSATGNPDAGSSQRMQEETARDTHQEQRIMDGVANGSLTRQEAGRLEQGQGRDDSKEYRDGSDGRLTVGQGRSVNRAQDVQSERIYDLKHNDVGHQ